MSCLKISWDCNISFSKPGLKLTLYGKNKIKTRLDQAVIVLMMLDITTPGK